MKNNLFTAVISFCLIATSLADQSAEGGGVFVKVLGKSGKIRVSRAENSTEDENSITVEMDEIGEVDSNGDAVGRSGPQKHSFNTFANQDFTFSQLEDDVQYENTSAQRFNFTASLASVNADLKVSVYIFKEAGNITVDGETTEVRNGTVKFNIEIGPWTFCTGDSCKKGQTVEIGASVDLTITIKGKGNVTAKSGQQANDPKKFSLGEGAEVILSRKVEIDGEIKDMPDGFPKLTNKGSKQMFTFRFEKWDNQVIYDPTIETAPGGGESPEESTTMSGDMTTRDVNSGITALPCMTILFASMLGAFGYNC